MKTLIRFATALLTFLIMAINGFAITHQVHIMNSAFSPLELTVQSGDSVVWVNMDTNPHTITAVDNSFDSGFLAIGASWGYLFTQSGSFAYICQFHSNMTAVIHVQTPTNGALHEVSIINSSFSPQALTINPGDTVRWTNNDSNPHTVTATDNSFDSGFLAIGATFELVFHQAGSFPYVCLFHSNMTGVITAGTQSGGDTTWTELQSPTTLPLNDVRFIDENHGWIAGDAGILYTTNGGDNWTLVNTAEDCEAVYFINESEGWACGNDGMILHSTNGGVNWSSQTSGVGEKIRDIWFSDSQNGWAVGRDGILIHTSNGGQNWSAQASPANDDLRGIYMLSSQSGWIVGSDGLILFTSNGGQSWETQLSVPGGEEDEFEAVFAVDENHAWAAGGQGRIYHTHDGGMNWTAQNSGTTVALMDIHFTDHDNGWVSGSGGFLANSMEEGTMWHTQLPPAFASFNGVYFVNAGLGFLVSGDGRIFKRSQITSDVSPSHEHGIVREAALAVNYPNPFNPSTTIEFTVGNRGPVQLEVFDILGQHIATLVDGPLDAGTHSAQFSGSHLPSGKYFYRLMAAGVSETKMMTLIK